MQETRRLAALAGLWFALAVATALAGTYVGPVQPKVLAAVNAHGKQFVLAHHARPGIDRREAIEDAIATAPWRGCVTGISLARTTHRSQRSAARTLVWLASIHPDRRVGPVGGPKPQVHSQSGGRAANYFVVAIKAANGRFVEAQDGQSSALPAWTKSRPRNCADN